LSIPLIEYAVVAALTMLAVLLGFWMGWRIARPETPLVDRKFDPGPTDIDDKDIWREALTPPPREKGVPTIK